MKRFKKALIAFYRLSRINVILHDYFPALTIISIIAVGFKVSILDFVIATLVSLSVHTYSFIVNDLEDAEDDARDEKKAKRNAISSGFITYKQGQAILQLAAFPALIIALAIHGIPAFLIVLSGIVTGHLYSWKKMRYKSFPFIDILSHCYALGIFQVVYFMFLPGADNNLISVLCIIGIGLFSMGGALYNQVRDWKVDVAAKLNNTAITIGKKNGQLLSVLFFSFGLALLAVAVILRLSRLS